MKTKLIMFASSLWRWVFNTVFAIGLFTIYYIATHEFYWELGTNYTYAEPTQTTGKKK